MTLKVTLPLMVISNKTLNICFQDALSSDEQLAAVKCFSCMETLKWKLSYLLSCGLLGNVNRFGLTFIQTADGKLFLLHL